MERNMNVLVYLYRTAAAMPKMARLAAVLAAVIVLAALAAPWVAPFPPEQTFFDGLTIEGAPLPPSFRFWFGTDLLGRDLFSRVVFGAQTSLVIGLVANGVALAVARWWGCWPASCVAGSACC
jgi:peptide/nickel transport system permease protein